MDELENDVLRMLLDGDNLRLGVLRSQLKHVVRRSREMTGVGFWTHLELANGTFPLSSPSSFELTDVIADIEGLVHGAGFVLFVRDGLIHMLEGFCYDEVWPPTITGYKLSYWPGAKRDLSALQNPPRWLNPRGEQ